MNPALLQKIAAGLMGGMPGGGEPNPAHGLGRFAGAFFRKRFGPQSQGAELPQTPYHFDPQGPPNIAPQAMPGVQQFTGPGMNVRQDPGFGPVPLGGRRTNRWGF